MRLAWMVRILRLVWRPDATGTPPPRSPWPARLELHAAHPFVEGLLRVVRQCGYSDESRSRLTHPRQDPSCAFPFARIVLHRSYKRTNRHVKYNYSS